MLERGEIDALISAVALQCVLKGSPKVRRLFRDYQTVKRDYFRRTGIYPIMHTVVIRKDDRICCHAKFATTVALASTVIGASSTTFVA